MEHGTRKAQGGAGRGWRGGRHCRLMDVSQEGVGKKGKGFMGGRESQCARFKGVPGIPPRHADLVHECLASVIRLCRFLIRRYLPLAPPMPAPPRPALPRLTDHKHARLHTHTHCHSTTTLLMPFVNTLTARAGLRRRLGPRDLFLKAPLLSSSLSSGSGHRLADCS